MTRHSATCEAGEGFKSRNVARLVDIKTFVATTLVLPSRTHGEWVDNEGGRVNVEGCWLAGPDQQPLLHATVTRVVRVLRTMRF